MSSKIENVFKKLDASTFRSSFKLNAKDATYLASKGLDVVRTHARKFLEDRIGAAEPVNDGSQTPMRGHPVFVAQHAVGTCCRGCTLKVHGIPQSRALTEAELDYLVEVIGVWLARQPLPVASAVAAPTSKSDPTESAEPKLRAPDKKQLSLF